MSTAALTLGDVYGGTKRQRYETYKAALIQERSSFEAHWREIGDYFNPRRTRFWTSDKNKGDKRNQKIINSAGRFAHRTLQSGLHAGLTSPARPWFKLGTPDPTLAEYGPVKEWLHLVTQRMQTVFSASNLYNALPVCYGDFGLFGTAAMSILDDTQDLFRAYTYPIGTYALGCDHRGRVSVFVRDYQLTVRQIVEQFGGPGGTVAQRNKAIDWSGISLTVRNLWSRGSYEAPVDITWMVQPNEDRNDRYMQAKYMPFKSCYWELGENRENTFLRESGFRTFPVLAPRWDITGEDTYGVACPGMDALPDQKQLQGMEKKKAKALEKMIDPPLQGPTELRTQKVSLLAGDVTYVNVRDGNQGLRSVHEINIDMNHLSIEMDRVEYRIKRAFYEDLFLMLAQSDPSRGMQPVTAREIEERHEEKLLALGPVLERTNDELLEPLIDRVYLMMDENGLIPPAPDQLQDVDLKVEFISIMAQAQKYVGVASMDRFVASTVPYFEALPEMKDSIDARVIVEEYQDMLGANPKVVRTKEEAKEIADNRDQAAAGMMQAQQAEQMAKAGKNLSDSKLQDGSSALDAVMGQGAGAVQ